MAVTYKPLWKTLIDKDKNKENLKNDLGLSSSTISKMSNNQYVALEVIDRLCTYLKVDIQDVVSHIKTEEES